MKGAKKAAAAEEEDEEEEDEEESEEEEEMKITSNKGKTAPAKAAAPATEVSLFIGNLPDDDGDRESKITEFFAEHGIKLREIRTKSIKR